MELLKVSRTVLQTTPLRWANLTGTLSDELLNRPPAEGEWAALDCLQHLVDTERWVFPIRVKAFLAGEDFPAFDPDAQGEISSRQLSPVQLAAEFAALRKESLALLETVTPADLPRTAIHAELGQVTLEEMLNEWVAHDLMHTVQAERAMMQPFIANVGPWESYFSDHVVK
ncbi:DinB family protein [bacterium]|nr:DinB family protein [bacterium]MCB2179119.1 DinB family protein [bacterium]